MAKKKRKKKKKEKWVSTVLEIDGIEGDPKDFFIELLGDSAIVDFILYQQWQINDLYKKIKDQ